MIEGHFVVLEGVDGAGTTTHTRRLAAALEGRGLPVATTREPSDGPVGVMIRQVLTGRLVVPGPSGARAPSWDTMALLFAADRLDHVEATITPNLMDGVTVISDRYVHSSLAYQSVTGGGDPDTLRWVREINGHARTPDLTIVLDVTPDVASRRLASRSGRPELYDGDALQRELIRFYAGIEQHFPDQRLVHVDGERPVDEVGADVLRHVLALRGEL